MVTTNSDFIELQKKVIYEINKGNFTVTRVEGCFIYIEVLELKLCFHIDIDVEEILPMDHQSHFRIDTTLMIEYKKTMFDRLKDKYVPLYNISISEEVWKLKDRIRELNESRIDEK